MGAAIRLRLREARRRGGLGVVGAAVLAVGLVAALGGDTPDGRYGLASDLAALLTFSGAILFGAFPLAIDRERRRSYLPSASPVTPWAWALGNGAGAALVAAAAGLSLYAAAGAGAALTGGIDTYAVTRIGGRGLRWLEPPGPGLRPGRDRVAVTDVPPDARQLRLVLRVDLPVEDAVGTDEAATITVNGVLHDVHWSRPLFVPIEPRRIEIRNVSSRHVVGIVRQEVRVLGRGRSFLANAALAGVAPALGAAALAALGTAAAAHLAAPVASLLVLLLLLLGSLKGFLLETFEHQGSLSHAASHAGHAHGPAASATEPGAAHGAATGVVKAALAVLPRLADLDRTARVAIGEWSGAKRSGDAALLLATALAVAGAVGGVGVHLRRMP